MIQKTWKTAGVVALIAFLCYVNSLEGDFVYDDSRAILKNADLLPTTPWSSLLFNDFWGTPLKHSGSHRSYRPVCVASFRLNYYLCGFKPWGYHLANVLLHCGVCMLLVFISEIIFEENITTFVAGVLFAVHPIHTEAISGVVGRADVGACFFYLASWLAYEKGCRFKTTGSKNEATAWPWIILSMFFVTLSMLTKEQGITAIGICALYDVLVVSQVRIQNFVSSLKQAKKNGLIGRISILVITGVTLLGMRMWLMGSKPPAFSQADNPAASSDSIQTRTFTFLLLPAMNFWLLVFPRTLCFDWSMKSIPLVEEPGDIRNAFSLVFYTSFTLLVTLCVQGLQHSQSKEAVNKTSSGSTTRRLTPKNFSLRNRKLVQKTKKKPETSNPVTDANLTIANVKVLNGNERAILSVAFLVLPFIPATNLFFYVGFVIAERILYIPSVGFCLLVAHFFSISWKLSGKFLRTLLVTATCVYLVLLLARTVRRNLDWRTDENLYRSGIPINPSKAWSNLGNVLKSQGKFAEAEHAYKKSLEARASADTWYNLGLLYQGQNRFQESLDCYDEAIALRSRFVLPYLNQGIVLETIGKKDRALAMLDTAARVDGTGLKDPKQHEYGVAGAKFHRGRILVETSRFDEAIEVFYDAMKTRPDHFPPYALFNLLGEALSGKGQIKEAETWYRKALESKPDHIPAHLAYANMLSKVGRLPEAEQTYHRAIVQAPENADVYVHYARHLSNHGNDMEAAQVIGKAAAVSPEDYDVVARAADAYRKVKDYENALRLYKQGAELKPDLPAAQMNLGAMYHLVGKNELAEKYYLKTLELAPDDKSTTDNLEKLRNKVKQKM